ncbi:mitogen activated protein kinase map-kinase (LMPK) [Leptomonas seymouri]|uniref:Mitogen-activated protein kinase n=1 Tax=Leptomonas seymouri TaxID=5684 RepID=A0A0N1IL28_LEPSE|nr:mitogen activated protein kinase map-kinase (LMPK) [Leptomonas seymouri]|eukprot:KPI87042.1 mitogen activated protein kinase map-kinase (LMPK) [Leptomonas seymouri]
MTSYGIDGEVEQSYRILRHIGSGAYGVVWCAVDRRTGRHIALKKVYDAFGNVQDAQRTYREVMLLQRLHGNPCIVGLLNVIRAANDIDLYLVFELVETDLTAIIRKKLLQRVHKQYLTYQMLRTVAQLHAQNIVHRDLKPANVFVSSDCSIKIGDFGLARTFRSGFDNKQDFLDLTEYIATRWYRSPEILVKSKAYSTAMDMWAMGCVIGEMLLGHPLFEGRSTLDQLRLIVEAIGVPSEDDLGSLHSPDIEKLMKSLPIPLNFAPLVENKNFKDSEATDLMTKLIVFNPTKRLTAIEALQHPYVAPFVRPGELEKLQNLEPIVLPLVDEHVYANDEYKAALYNEIDTKYRYHIADLY